MNFFKLLIKIYMRLIFDQELISEQLRYKTRKYMIISISNVLTRIKLIIINSISGHKFASFRFFTAFFLINFERIKKKFFSYFILI